MKVSYILFLLFFSVNILAQDFNSGVISSRLQQQLYNSDEFHHIAILLSDRVDVQSMDESFYRQNVSLQERAFTLISSLKEKAASTQQNILSFLYQSDNVDQASINTYWISNLIFVKAKKEVITQLSFRNDIEWMDINAELMLSEYEDIEITDQ